LIELKPAMAERPTDHIWIIMELMTFTISIQWFMHMEIVMTHFTLGAHFTPGC